MRLDCEAFGGTIARSTARGDFRHTGLTFFRDGFGFRFFSRLFVVFELVGFSDERFVKLLALFVCGVIYVDAFVRCVALSVSSVEVLPSARFPAVSWSWNGTTTVSGFDDAVPVGVPFAE